MDRAKYTVSNSSTEVLMKSPRNLGQMVGSPAEVRIWNMSNIDEMSRSNIFARELECSISTSGQIMK